MSFPLSCLLFLAMKSNKMNSLILEFHDQELPQLVGFTTDRCIYSGIQVLSAGIPVEGLLVWFPGHSVNINWELLGNANSGAPQPFYRTGNSRGRAGTFCPSIINRPSISVVYQFREVVRILFSLAVQLSTPIKGESTSEREQQMYHLNNKFQSIKGILPQN